MFDNGIDFVRLSMAQRTISKEFPVKNRTDILEKVKIHAVLLTEYRQLPMIWKTGGVEHERKYVIYR